MSLRIIKSGLYDTIQDGGRYGYRHWGINPGGAMDKFSADLANLILGNDISEAVFELHFPGPILMSDTETIISISGADFAPMVNERPVELNQPILLQAHDVLYFKKQRHGRVCYVAVQGGLLADEWLNSSSTNHKLGVDGHKGRTLKVNDIVEVKNSMVTVAHEFSKNKLTIPWQVNHQPDADETIWVLPGKDFELLDDRSQKAFFDSTYSISSQSDRMGFYLKGDTLHLAQPVEMVSFPVNFGTIQLLPDGRMIVLMADHQTTGGYPCIANVIVAHRSKLAQKNSGSAIRFSFMDIEKAETLHLEQQRFLRQVKVACRYKWLALF